MRPTWLMAGKSNLIPATPHRTNENIDLASGDVGMPSSIRRPNHERPEYRHQPLPVLRLARLENETLAANCPRDGAIRDPVRDLEQRWKVVPSCGGGLLGLDEVVNAVDEAEVRLATAFDVPDEARIVHGALAERRCGHSASFQEGINLGNELLGMRHD